jgi:hypothetical protein
MFFLKEDIIQDNPQVAASDPLTLKVLKLPHCHKPHVIVLTADDWRQMLDEDPFFAGMLLEQNIPKEYFTTESGKKEISEINNKISVGTCEDQSNYLCMLYLSNSNLSIEELYAGLEKALPKLIRHYAKKKFLCARPKNGELREKLDISFYGETFMAAKDSDGYCDSVWLRLRTRFEREILQTELARFLQNLYSYCSLNQHNFATLITCDLEGNLVKGGNLSGHELCMIKKDSSFILLDTNSGCLYQGSLELVIQRILLNILESIVQYWSGNKGAFVGAIDYLLQELTLDLDVTPVLMEEKLLLVEESITQQATTAAEAISDAIVRYVKSTIENSMPVVAPVNRPAV